MAYAERLAARRYTTADGLSGDYILRAMRDSRGFLWFATRDGLSRFDGVRFVVYGAAHGLPANTINDVLETRNGTMWIATNGAGVCLFDPRGGKKLFITVPVGKDLASNRVNRLFEDRHGTIWAGTDDGLFSGTDEGDRTSFRKVTMPLISDAPGFNSVGAMTEDRHGNLWVGGNWGLVRRLPDGRSVVYRLEPSSSRDSVGALQFDDAGRLWVGFRSGLYLHHPPPIESFPADPAIARGISRTQGAGDDRWFTTANGLPDNTVTALHLRRGGEVWVGTQHGVGVIERDVIRAITPRQGVPDIYITDLLEDAAGSLWITTFNGAIRLIRDGLVSFDEHDGLASSRIHSSAVDAAGRFFVVTGEYEISQFDGTRFRTARAQVPKEALCSWMSLCASVARSGDWWVPTTLGLYRWPAIERVEDFAKVPPADLFDVRHGLPENAVFSTFEDRLGDVWVGTTAGGVVRRKRGGAEWHVYTEADGLPPLKRTYGRLASFAEDRSGVPWFAFDTGGLARFRDGRFEVFSQEQGAPIGGLSSLLIDRDGRLWIGSTQTGIMRVDDPTAAAPVFRAFTTSDGLASNNVRCLAHDDLGRLYAGTSRGIDRIDPVTGTLRHFSLADGLASDFVTSATRDRSGALWFGTINGLSRLTVEPGTPAAPSTTPPTIFIDAVRLAGRDQPVSELGEVGPAALTVPPGRGPLQIEYFGFSFEPGSPLRYQYRLEGAEAEWSAPSEQRGVTYASLASGSYRFLVRAVRSDGVVSQAAAVLAFNVLPPFYARWWFIVMIAAALGGMAFVLYRMRVAQLLRVERVRARISTDLHDDIGASLSQIAILAEVARQRMRHDRPANAPEPAAAEPLERIAETSRGLVDSMSDIVWAINPEVDSLADLVHRMRRFVEDTLGAGDIDVTFRAPESKVDLKLGADLRREIFLILKESVTNIAKHARATRVAIDFENSGRRLWLRISDNGQGFDPAEATDGHGVASMRRRVAALGGRLTIDSAQGRGTTITLDVERWNQ